MLETELEYEPVEQVAHVVARTSEYVPALQLVHADLPVVDVYVPAAQGVQ